MAIKNGDKNVMKRTQIQYDKILAFMKDGREYRISASDCKNFKLYGLKRFLNYSWAE